VGISQDGSMLLISVFRTSPVSQSRDLFFAAKQTDGTWGILNSFGTNVNSIRDDEHPSMPVGNNAIYFYLAGPHGGDICVSTRVDTVWQPHVALPAPVNTADREFDPCISADAHTLWFVRQNAQADNTLFYSMRTDTSGVSPRSNRIPSRSPQLGVHCNGNRLILGITGSVYDRTPSVTVYDILGRCAFSRTVLFTATSAGAQGTLHMGPLAAGMYFVQVRYRNQPLVGKVVIP
jgi:hypothetical protein